MPHHSQSGLFDYDKLMRLPVVLFFVFLLVREIGFLGNFLDSQPVQLEIHFIAAIGARIALIFFLLLTIVYMRSTVKPNAS